jgi:hypothetical protein
MGIAYVCKPDRKLALVVWDGVVTWDDWWQHLPRMLSDPDFAAMEIQLTDLRYAAISPTISKDQIQTMVDLLRAQREHLSLRKVAIVAGDQWEKPKLAALGFESVSVAAIVFNELTASCQWLGVDAAAVAADIEELRPKLREVS